MPQIPPAQAPRDVNAQERLLFENFDTSGSWDTYNTLPYFAAISDGAFRMLLQDTGTFLWSTNSVSYQDVIAQVDVTWLSDNPQTIAGVICYLSPARDGEGYYVLIAQDGAFSIRRGGQFRDDALVKWQRSSAIPNDQSTLTMRVICADSFIGLYVNGQYIEGVEDDRMTRGYLGLTVGLPPTAASAETAVQFDNLRVWQTGTDG